MTAPAIESTTNTSFGSDTTSHVANYPASVTAGWLLLILASFDGTTTVNTPSGYDVVGSGNQGDASISTAVFAKIAAGSEGGGTIDVTTSNVQQGGVQILAISGWKGALADIIKTQRNNELGYGGPGMPAGSDTPWRKIDYRYIRVMSKTSTSSFNSAPSGLSATTQAGQDSATGAAVRCEHTAITDLIFAALFNVPTGHGSSSAIMPEFDLLIPQAFIGTVSGTVTLSGSPVSGANVRVINQTTGDEFTGTTNGSGVYSIAVPNTTDLYHVVVTYNDGSDDYNALSLWDVDAV